MANKVLLKDLTAVARPNFIYSASFLMHNTNRGVVVICPKLRKIQQSRAELRFGDKNVKL